MKKLLFSLFLIVLSLSVNGKDIRILAIGNSFSEDGVEQYLYELALEGNDKLIIGNAYRGGQGLESHWTVVEAGKADFEYRKIVDGKKTNNRKTLEECVVDEPWDYITFQQVSQDSGRPETYEPYLGNLLDYVKTHATNPDVKFGIHQTWAYAKDSGHGGFANYDRDQMKMYNAIVDAVNKAKEAHADISFIVPSGTAIQNGRTSFIGDNFNRDGYHLDYGIGRYTAACTWLEKITGQTPVDKKYMPSEVNEVTAMVAQYAAHAAVETPNAVTNLENIGYDGDNTTTPGKPINVNFGSVYGAGGWNNITPSNKSVFGLKDMNGSDTQIVTILDDEFNGTNGEGVQQTTTSLNMPVDVAKSCVWAYAQGNFENKPQQPTGGFLFFHLNKNLVYDFCIFGSRKGSTDNRETAYTLTGENTRRGYLNTAGNGDKTVTIKGVRPNANGEIRLTVAPGENNNNANKFYYINALQMVARAATADDQIDEISDARDLLKMDPNTNYVLTADIDLTGVTLGECVLDSYYGTLDGQGHIISGLAIDKINSGEVGLFRHLRGGTIKNLGIEKASVLGNSNVGALAGQSHGGVIENCYIANSTISGRDHVGSLIGQMEGNNGVGSQIKNCYSTANVYSRENQGGGLVGTSTAGAGSILNCYFAGRVEVSSQRIGGILALQDNDDLLTITNCANLAVQLKCGQIYRIASVKADKSALTNNYALSTLPAPNGTDLEKGIDVTAERAKEKAFYSDDLKWVFDDATWKWVDGIYPVFAWQKEAETTTPLVFLSQSAPVLALKKGDNIDLSKYYTSGNGGTLVYSCTNNKIKLEGSIVSVAESVEITDLETVVISASVAGFKAVELSLSLAPEIIPVATAEDFISRINAATNASFKLTADLDFANVSFNGIENFSGQLDGNGHIIKNLNIQRTGDVKLGLFLSTNGAVIKNLGIENSTIGTKDNKHIGGFIGEMNGGNITGCYVGNSRIVGQDHVGALVGQLKSGALMSDCYSTAYVQTTGWQAGGLVGSIDNATIDKSYFSGVLVGNWNRTGGIAGLKNGGDETHNFVKNCANFASYIIGADAPKRIMGDGGVKVENSYSLASTRIGKNVSEAASVTCADAADQNGADMTLQQARMASFYTETLKWDMENTWSVPVDGESYPVLKWQLERGDKIPTGLYAGTDIQPARIAERLYFATDTYSLPQFVSTNGLTLTFQSDNADVITIEDLTLTPVAFGSAAVTMEMATGMSDKFTANTVVYNCKVVPTEGVVEITTADDLLMLNTISDRDYVLVNDIDMTGITFNGLCSETTPFTGTFDGQDHVIKGLKINNSGTSVMGFFRKVKNATIKNLDIIDAAIVGGDDTGILAGIAEGGKIEHCYVNNSTVEGGDRVSAIAARILSGAVIENCYVKNGSIKAKTHQAGGISAASFDGGATIRNCYFEGTITSQYGHVGAMLGLMDRDGDVTIENCLNLASSIAGGHRYRICNWGGREAMAHFTNNYSISTTVSVGGDWENMDDRIGTNLPDDADAKSLKFYTETLKWDFDNIWTIEDGVSYPVFKKNAIKIATADEFIEKINADVTGNFVLTADLDFADVVFNGIESFAGVLNGDGHIIKNLNIQREGEGKLGLFLLTQDAEIRNVGIENSVIGTAKNKHIGAFVGEMNGGSMVECYVGNTRIVGQDHVGALVGQLSAGALMSNCYSTAYVQTTGWQAGGLIGSINKATVDKSYFSGVVVGRYNRTGGVVGLKNGGDDTDTFVKNSVNMASYIVGDDSPKRIMGDVGIKLENNYSLVSAKVGKAVESAVVVTCDNATDQNGADMTLEQAKTASFYTETLQWDMTDTWTIPAAGAYPVLKWQLNREDKLKWNVYEGIDVLSEQTTKTIFLSKEAYDLSRFVASNGLALSYHTKATNITIEGSLLTPKATSGSAVVTVSAGDAAKADFAEVSVTLNCKMIAETGVIEITTPDDLLIVNAFAGRDFILMNDIDMTGVAFTGLCSEANPFIGTFDGAKHSIKGLNFNEANTSAMGLFRKIKGATIKNVYLEEVNFTGNENVGGITGMAEGGKIELCSVKNSYIEGRDRVAAIAAWIGGGVVIENCYVANSEVKAREHQAGGIAGASLEGGATIRNCYFEGTLENKYGHMGAMLGLIDRDADVTIANCLNLASSITSESGNPYRICSWGGHASNARFTNNYSISTTTGCKEDADDRNGTTLTNDTDAKSAQFYTTTLGWDFNAVWQITEGESYPVFRAKPVGVTTEVSSDVITVYSIEGGIEVIAPRAQRVNIYSADGSLVRSVMLKEGHNAITGIATGLYIVNNVKVVVK